MNLKAVSQVGFVLFVHSSHLFGYLPGTESLVRFLKYFPGAPDRQVSTPHRRIDSVPDRPVPEVDLTLASDPRHLELHQRDYAKRTVEIPSPAEPAV